MINLRRFAVVALMLLMATGASASNFRAADLVYLPAAVNSPGQGGAFFKTDVWITNVSDVTVDVDMAFGLTGGVDRRDMLQPANLKRITLAAGESREIVDIIGTQFNAQGLGHMLFFACRQGGNCSDCDASGGDCKPITVQARIYTTAAAAGCPAGIANCTFGQLFSGLPWYNYVSMTSQSIGLGEVVIVGLRQTGSGGQASTYRSNLGFVNSSSEHQTVLRVRIFSNNNPTTPAATTTVTLGPLAHVQQNVSVLFPTFTGSGFVIVDQQSATVVTGNANPPEPGFFAYGSVLDNGSNDPTTQEAQYKLELPFGAVYQKTGMKRPARRP